MGVPIRLGGGWDSPRRGSGTVPGFMPGWVVPLGLGGGWEYPVQWLMGSGTVPGFIPGWDGVRVCWWVSPWAVGIVQDNYFQVKSSQIYWLNPYKRKIVTKTNTNMETN